MNSVNNKYEALITSYLDGQCTSEEALELLSWVAESEDNRLYFKSLKEKDEVWTLTDFAMPDDIDLDAALDVVNAKIDAIEEENEAKKIEMPWLRRNYQYVSGIAAAIVVALFFGFLVAKPFNSNITVAYNGQDETSSFVLPDGTSVDFDAEGAITYPKHFTKSARSVDFEGTAYFDVVKDEERPFVIHCDGMDVEVLGTSFLLNADKDAERYTVDLYTGKVRMTSFDKKGRELAHVDVLPGERGVFDANEGELKMMSYSEVKEEELMTEHVLVFNNEKLSKIVEALEYIYKVDIDLGESCASKKLTARFSDDESIDDVLETIALVSEVTVSKKGETYLIR